MNADTIVAISTPPGTGAIGIVRLSGPDASEIAARVFRVGAGLPAHSKGRPRSPLRARHATFGYLADPQTGETLDEGILTWFPAPHSYTGEEIVEISIHGNPILLERAVSLLARLGARVADPGEFTRRAFSNGKIDLAQAEAVADLISASSDAGARAARRVVQGDLSRRVAALRVQLTAVLGHTEAVIDFAEEPDVQDRALLDIVARLEECESKISDLLAGHDKGRKLREGSIALLAGEPNVGKSSLMNRLAGRDVSIVHPTPGTTRDVVREWIEMDGVPVELHDTAGLRSELTPTSILPHQGGGKEILPAPPAGEGAGGGYSSHAEIEAAGIAKTVDLFDRADLVVWVLDAGLPKGVHSIDHFHSLLSQANGAMSRWPFCSPSPKRSAGGGAMARSMFVLNKSDLGTHVDLSWLPSPAEDVVHVSALTGEGVPALQGALRAKLASGIQSDSELLLLRPRHAQSLENARSSLQECRRRLSNGAPPDLLAVDLREAKAHLDEITGAITTEDLLDRIFSDFCVGK